MIITKFDLKTPGREDEDHVRTESKVSLGSEDFAADAKAFLAGLGGSENIYSLDNCVTRLRVDVKNYAAVDENAIKAAGARGVVRSGSTSVQIVIGTQVQHVADEMKKLII